MTWIYLIVLLFSALTIFFVCGDYKKGKFSKIEFIIITILLCAVIVVSAGLIVFSLM